MMKRLSKILMCMVLLVFSLTVFAQGAAGQWKQLSGYWPTSQLLMDMTTIQYDKDSETAHIWVKWVFNDGQVNRGHYLINFPKATMQPLYQAWSRSDGTFVSELKHPAAEFPIKPDSWQEEAGDIVADKVGRNRVYGAKHWKHIGTVNDDVWYIGDTTTTFDRENQLCYVWFFVKARKGNTYTTCYCFDFSAVPYKLGKVEGGYDALMHVGKGRLDQILLIAALAQYEAHGTK